MGTGHIAYKRCPKYELQLSPAHWSSARPKPQPSSRGRPPGSGRTHYAASLSFTFIQERLTVSVSSELRRPSVCARRTRAVCGIHVMWSIATYTVHKQGQRSLDCAECMALGGVLYTVLVVT